MDIKKYIDLKNVNWSCGVRKGNPDDISAPEFHCYVTISDVKGFHTILGNDMDEMLKICYNDFLKGDRNNFLPYVMKHHHKTLSEKIKEIL